MISMLKKLLTKFHIYLGLFLLVDLWLFSLTGLFLSHPKWSVNDYQTESRWIETTASVTPAQGGDAPTNAEHYLAQLDLTGEVSNLREQENQFGFNVRRPGIEAQVTIDPRTGDVSLREKTTDAYGTLNTLHIFNGMIHHTRIVPLDGRDPLDDDILQWQGSSRGHWEGSTLVVESTNFTDKTPSFPSLLGAMGTGETLHLTERFTNFKMFLGLKIKISNRAMLAQLDIVAFVRPVGHILAQNIGQTQQNFFELIR